VDGSGAAVIAVRNDKWGERPMALTIVKPQLAGGVPEAEEAIRAHVRSYMEKGVVSKMAVPD
jgi:fatty-acyl-CoA synthase